MSAHQLLLLLRPRHPLTERWVRPCAGRRGGSTAEVTRAVFARNQEYAVYVRQAGSTLTLRDAAVIESYDLGRLQDRVAYGDNGTNLQATSLPVPDPLSPLP